MYSFLVAVRISKFQGHYGLVNAD